MLKIIELDIDPEVSGETGVWEVAWVEMPAIEQELIYFSTQKFYKAPEGVSEMACRAIRENEERGNPAATQVGKIRGQQLCSRSEISLETIKRMKSYLERAATYNSGNWDDNGTISYNLWGGEPALRWVNTILEKEETMADEGPCWEGYEMVGMKEKDGRMVPNCVKIENSKQEFVYPTAGEGKDEFLQRCMSSETMKDEFPDTDQRYAVCNSYYDKEKFALQKVSFDWDGTLSTARGKDLLEQELANGNLVYIITARNTISDEIRRLANDYNIPASKVIATSSNISKIETIKRLGIDKHYDNNPDVIKELGKIGQRFDYDTGGLPPYASYPETGATNAMLVKPILTPQDYSDCGCKKESKFTLLGYKDGLPVFSSQEEAELYAETEAGCNGSHSHIDEEGNEVWMPCELHPEDDIDDGIELEDLLAQGWEIKSVGPVQNIEEIHSMARDAFSKITKEEFYSISTRPNGYSSLDQYGGNKIRFIYAVGPGMGAQLIKTSRDFCKRMLGGRQFVFRYEDILALNAQLMAVDGTSRKIIPRPKGTEPDIFQWKGGANCRHIWLQLIFSSGVPDEGYTQEITNDVRKEQRKATMVSPVAGQGGNVNPKARPVKGDRLEAFASEKMSEYWDDEELRPVGYIQGLPIFEDIVDAQDASYFLNCGGVTEEVEFMGKTCFQACSYKAKKQEEPQIFKSIKEKKMVYTPLMIPNILIPRVEEITGERYFVKFRPDVIEKIQQKFMIEQRLRETNLEHTDKKFSDVVMVESWIVNGDSDKAYSLGFTKEQIPVGTWMAGYKFLDTQEGNKVWNDYVKKGVVRGASVEGNFILNFSREKKDEYLLEEIIKILNSID